MLRDFAKLHSMPASRLLIVCLVLALPALVHAQKDKTAPAKADLTGRYEGTAKNSQQADITVALELTEKDGAVTGMIKSSHGDFTISSGTHQGNDVTLGFDTGGPAGTMTLKVDGDKLTGAWTAGDDEGPIEVTKAAAQQEAPKGKS